MGCRCNERAAAIVKAAIAVKAGDMKTVAEQAAIFGRTAVDDARDLTAYTRSRAAAMLGARRR